VAPVYFVSQIQLTGKQTVIKNGGETIIAVTVLYSIVATVSFCNLFEDTACNSDYKRMASKGVLISE